MPTSPRGGLLRMPLIFIAFAPIFLFAQEKERSLISDGVPEKVARVLSSKAEAVARKLNRKTKAYLEKFQKAESKLRKKMWLKDTVLAQALFDGVQEKYAFLSNASAYREAYTVEYVGRLDSLMTALRFLSQNNASGPELQKALLRFSSLQQDFAQCKAIESFLMKRGLRLKEVLAKVGMWKDLHGFQKHTFYFAAQVRAYKEWLLTPSKIEERLLQALFASGDFQQFFQQHSQLASLFPLGAGGDLPGLLQGLQTRSSVQQGLQDRFGTGVQVQQMIQQNLQAAQEQLSEIKSKLNQYSSGAFGNSTAEIELPEGLKPNRQKTKTFLQRLEYGANVQSQKARDYFPATSDIGFSLGYKFSDNSSLGVGASYKIGWGRGWNNLRITHEGVGLRSYVDVKIKGSLSLSGGYEQNYRTAFRNLQQLKAYNAWQTSGLVGVSKQYNVSRKLKGELKLLWDFLSYQQVPRTQAVLFRVGYSLR